MKYILTILCFILATSVYAKEYKVGNNIDELTRVMEDAKYGDGSFLLAWAFPPGKRARMWAVGQGSVIATYTEADKIITHMTFYHSDERPKLLRKTFMYEITSFDPDTGKMVIQTKSKVEQGGGDNYSIHVGMKGTEARALLEQHDAPREINPLSSYPPGFRTNLRTTFHILKNKTIVGIESRRGGTIIHKFDSKTNTWTTVDKITL